MLSDQRLSQLRRVALENMGQVECQMCPLPPASTTPPFARDWTDQGALDAMTHLVTDHRLPFAFVLDLMAHVIENNGAPFPDVNDAATPDTPPERRHP
jgi:hypothetical protein